MGAEGRLLSKVGLLQALLHGCHQYRRYGNTCSDIVIGCFIAGTVLIIYRFDKEDDGIYPSLACQRVRILA